MIARNKEIKAEIVEYDGKTPLKGKREKFAQLIATNTKNNTEAARGAGYKDNKGLRRYAHDLATNPNILARSAYIRAELAKKWEITKDSQVRNYLDIADRAKESGDLRAEISANNSIDKLSGLIVDKSVVEQSDAQKARSATERRLSKEFTDWYMARSLARPEGLQELETVDITGANVLLEDNTDDSRN